MIANALKLSVTSMYKVGDSEYYHTLTEGKLAFLSAVKNSNHLNSADKERLASLLSIHIEQHTPKSQFLEIIAQDPQLNTEEFSQIKTTMARSAEHLLPREQINQDPTIGAVESFLPATLLTEPTPLMRDTVKKISGNIVETLNDYVSKDFKFDNSHDMLPIFEIFVKNFIHESDLNYPGRFSLEHINQNLPPGVNKINSIQDQLDPSQIKSIINNVVKELEDPNIDFHRELIMQNMFSFMIKHTPIITNTTPGCTQEIADLEAEFNKRYGKDYRTELQNPESEQARTFICDTLMYQNTFYTAEQKRGRGKPDEAIRTNKLGVMRNTDETLRSGLPELQTKEKWVDWTQCPYEKDSKYVGLMVDNEVPFVSSFSGTISLMMNLMVSSNVLQSKEEQYAYMSSCYAFIVGLGYHSTHEVLGPVAHCLNLIDPTEYKVTTAQDYGDDKPNHPPNYYAFFKSLIAYDKDFAAKRTQAWDKTVDWYNNCYLKYQPEAPNISEMVSDLDNSRANDIIFALNVCSQCAEEDLKDQLVDYLKDCCFENDDMADIISSLNDNPKIDKGLLDSLNGVLQNISVFENTEKLENCVRFEYSAEGLKFYRDMNEVIETDFNLFDLQGDELTASYLEAIHPYLEDLNIDSDKIEEIEQVIKRSLEEQLDPGSRIEIAVINDGDILQLISNKTQEKQDRELNKDSKIEGMESVSSSEPTNQQHDNIKVEGKQKQIGDDVDETLPVKPSRQKHKIDETEQKLEQVETNQQEVAPTKPRRQKRKDTETDKKQEQAEANQQDVAPTKPIRQKRIVTETDQKQEQTYANQQESGLAKLIKQQREINQANEAPNQVHATQKEVAPTKPKRKRSHLSEAKLEEETSNENFNKNKYDRKSLFNFDKTSAKSTDNQEEKLNELKHANDNDVSTNRKKP